MKLEKIREKNALIDAIFKNKQYIAWIKDIDGVILACSKGALETFELTEEETVGKTDYDLIDKETADHFAELDKQVIESGGFLYIADEEFLTPKGVKVWETFRAPIFDDEGNIIGTFGFSKET